MAGSERRAMLKGIRRTAVIVVIVTVAISAVLGIVLLLTGGWGDLQGRILGTAFAIAVFATLALCHLAQADRPLRVVGYAGLATSLLALIPALILLWAQWPFISDDVSNWLLKAFALFGILAVSLAQANLLLLLASRHRRVVRVVLAVALVMIGVVAIMLLLPILSDWEIPGADGDWYWRLFGVAAILDAVGTIVLPVLGLVLRDSPAGTVALLLHPSAALVAELDARAAAAGSTRVEVAEAALVRGFHADEP